jgi:hypothetical protein
MTERQIIQLLWDLGHFRNPAHPETQNVAPGNLDGLRFGDAVVKAAARSYQEFMAVALEPLSALHHGRMPVYDGEIGPATRELFTIERCGCPDFAAAVDAATGSGSWPTGCQQQYAAHHAITVNVKPAGIPVFLRPVWETVWANVESAYAEIGLQLIRADGNVAANIQISFEPLSGSTIGLAIVGQGQRCGTSIWAKFDPGYQPSNIVREWTSLVKHELGHNMGLSHSQGGVMNPSIVPGLPVSWIGDPSASILTRWFGGQPVPIDPHGPEMWVRQCLLSDRGRELCLPLFPPRPVVAA